MSEEKKDRYYLGIGRRKTAVARVRLMNGKGDIEINGKTMMEYFDVEDSGRKITEPLVITSMDKKLDVQVRVLGGGKSAQTEAVRHGISRALLLINPELRSTLRKAGYLTRDPRVKERKKYGLKRARKAPQFTKR